MTTVKNRSGSPPKLDEFLDSLENVRKDANGWNARCPLHDDAKNSLSVSLGNDGKLLIHCHAGCNTPQILYQCGLTMRELFPDHGRRKSRGEIVAEYDYCDESGKLLFQVVRLKPKNFQQRQPDGKGDWTWSTKGVQKVVYRLPELLAADASEPVFIVEGEKDVDRMRGLGLVATTSAGGGSKGKSKWLKSYNAHFHGRHVVLLPDNDEAGKAHAESIAHNLHGKATTVRILELPDLAAKGDVSDWLDAGCTVERLRELANQCHEWTLTEGAPPSEKAFGGCGDGGDEQKSQATLLVELAERHEVELFRIDADDSEAYASIVVRGHRETHRLGTQRLKDWLCRLFYDEHEKAPNSQALNDANNVLRGRALFEGKSLPVHRRLAGDDSEIWLDLANDEWQHVKITADGWQIVGNVTLSKGGKAITDSTPRFIRPRGLKPLPTPEAGCHISELRRFVNVRDDADWLLIVAWLVATFRPRGPYPILAVNGEQGSAKTTTCRMLRKLVDPNRADLRSEPRDERDLMIAASNAWLVGFDNFSRVPPWLSDALCRLATGGGFATRELYSDGEEKLFDAMRPVLLNGIPDLATRPDLLDRSITVTLPTIAEDRRRPESELWEEFEKARARLLGAILDCVSCAIRKLPEVNLPTLPRMADFAEWATAAEPAFGVTSQTFLGAYSGNQESANELAIESSPIAAPLLEILEPKSHWRGTASALLENLEDVADDAVTRRKDWPKRANILSGHLRRIAPNLRKMGVQIEFDRRISR